MRLTNTRFTRLGAFTATGLLTSLAMLGISTSASAAHDGGEREASRTVLVSARTAQLSPDSLTTACLFFNKVSQPAGAAITHRHQAGVIYAASGGVRVTVWQDGLAPSDPGSTAVTHDLAPGSGAFLPNHWWHQHSNSSSTSSNAWYFASILASSTCANLPPSAVHGNTFAVPPASSYAEKLIRTTVDPGGKSELHEYRGVSETLVLDGSVRLTSDGSDELPAGDVTVGAGHGFFLNRGNEVSITNRGTSEATLLTFRISP